MEIPYKEVAQQIRKTFTIFAWNCTCAGQHEDCAAARSNTYNQIQMETVERIADWLEKQEKPGPTINTQKFPGPTFVDLYEAFEGVKAHLSVECKSCYKEFRRSVLLEELQNWSQKAFTPQDAFPDLAEEWRELLFVSRLCPTCFERKNELDTNTTNVS